MPTPESPAGPPAGRRVPGSAQQDVAAASSISVGGFPADPGVRGHRRVTARRAARRGHGPRGPVLPPEVPRWSTRAQEFDATVLDAFAEIDQRWHSRLGQLDLAVDMVPRMRLKDGEDWPEEVIADGRVPVARLVPAGVDRLGRPTRARIVLFRRALTRRAPGRGDLRDLVYSLLVELVAQHLEVSPDEVESGPR